MKVRTRFAPSPTGFLHIGGVRTALYSWLFARKHHGEFILRIEDTDRERSTTESVNAILEGMEWLQLNYDAGPYYQTERLDRYFEVAEKLLQSGKAYRCYCSKERLTALREQQMKKGEKPRYDGHCRSHAPHDQNEPSVIRFKNPDAGDVRFTDQVYGEKVFQNQELDDLVLVRSDGMPTYNFSVVIDDTDMQITHVIRGDDHINNTPRQINLLQAMDVAIPVYAHLPMILGSDGKRLSKRHGAVNVLNYQEEGYLPEALLNYLLRLGWSHGDQEIFSRDEMISLFSLDAVNKAPAAFNPEKLLWVNQHYLKSAEVDRIAALLKTQYENKGIDASRGPQLNEIVLAFKERAKTINEMADETAYFFDAPAEYDADAVSKHISADTLQVLQIALTQLQSLETWDKEHLKQAVNDVLQQAQVKMPYLAQPLRIALSGNTHSPSIDLTLALIGKDESLARIEKLMRVITSALDTQKKS